MSEQLFFLAAAVMCVGLGVYFVHLALTRTERNPILIFAYGLLAASIGFSCWAILRDYAL